MAVHGIERRHPHVFAGVKYSSEEELHSAWLEIKKEEKKGENRKMIILRMR